MAIVDAGHDRVQVCRCLCCCLIAFAVANRVCRRFSTTIASSCANSVTEAVETASFRSQLGFPLILWGNYVIVCSRNHRVQVLKPDGTFVTSFGKPGSGPGQSAFEWPRGVHVSPVDDRIFVSYGNLAGNGRGGVQVYAFPI